MDFMDFTEKVHSAVKEELGAGYQVQLQKVQKNNGVQLTGIVILGEGQNVSPTIYLNPLWAIYRMGRPFSELVEYVIASYRQDTPKYNVNMEFFKDFEQVKDRICYRLIHKERNRELLENIPHVEFLDLAICFYYSYQGRELGTGSILIHNSHMEMWDCTTAQLMRLANSNTIRLFPMEYSSMEMVIRELTEQLKEDGEDPMMTEEEQQLFFQEMPLQILSNETHAYGASCLLYPGLLQQLAQWAAPEGEDAVDLYILPSSIHEVIILPRGEVLRAESLWTTIQEVNETQVKPEEVLSDNLYIYRASEQRMEIV